MTTIREFFETLGDRVDPDRTAGMHNTFAFDIEGVGQWTVTVDDGSISVAEGVGSADCTIRANEKTMTKIVTRRSNPTTAYMTGKLKIDGDMGAALKLQKLL